MTATSLIVYDSRADRVSSCRITVVFVVAIRSKLNLPAGLTYVVITLSVGSRRGGCVWSRNNIGLTVTPSASYCGKCQF